MEKECKQTTMSNEYFISVFKHEDRSSMPEGTSVFRGSKEEKLQDISINKELVLKSIDSITSIRKTAPGHDEVFLGF